MPDICYESLTMKHFSESMQLRLSPKELADLDAYCAARRRETGEPWPRMHVVRQAIRTLIGEDQRDTKNDAT